VACDTFFAVVYGFKILNQMFSPDSLLTWITATIFQNVQWINIREIINVTIHKWHKKKSM